jgi:hypothetical protein
MMSDLNEAADRLKAALDPDKRGGWTRLMGAGHGEPSEVEDLRTVIASAHEVERLRTELAEARAEAEDYRGKVVAANRNLMRTNGALAARAADNLAHSRLLEARVAELLEEKKALAAKLDAYKRAKAENDERFQIEASKHRERAERAEAKLDAVKALIKPSFVYRLDEHGEKPLRFVIRKVAAILADTDEGSEK